MLFKKFCLCQAFPAVFRLGLTDHVTYKLLNNDNIGKETISGTSGIDVL